MGTLHSAGIAPRILIRQQGVQPRWSRSPNDLDEHVGGQGPSDAAEEEIDPNGVVPPNLDLYIRREEEEESSEPDRELEWDSPAPIPLPAPPPIIHNPPTHQLRVAPAPFTRHQSLLRREEQQQQSSVRRTRTRRKHSKVHTTRNPHPGIHTPFALVHVPGCAPCRPLLPHHL